MPSDVRVRRAIVSLVTGVFVVSPAVGAAQRSSIPAAELQRLLAVEDSRTTNPDSQRILLDALADRRATVRALAARALGRFEHVAFLEPLTGTLSDPDPEVRAEGANALAQIARAATGAATDAEADAVVDRLLAVADPENVPSTLGAMARSLGRMVRPDATGQRVDEWLRRRAGASTDPRALVGIVHGLYDATRLLNAGRRTPPATATPSALEMRLIRYGLRAGARESSPGSTAPRVRRLAMLTIGAANERADSVATLAITDPDDQVRRLAVVLLPAVRDSAMGQSILRAALKDPAFIVRFEAVRQWRRLRPTACDPLIQATHDTNPHVMLAAIDALGGCTNQGAAIAALEGFVARPVTTEARRQGSGSWHAHAHALVSLARLGAPSVSRVIRTDATSPVWEARMYAARAAAVARDTAALLGFATDSASNVREAAIQGLVAVVGHARDDLYQQALGSADYQVVLAGARALQGGSGTLDLRRVLLDNLDRLTRDHRDNSRDPRAELVDRIDEFGVPADSQQLAPYAQDVDPVIAGHAARILSRWLGRPVSATPQRRPMVSDSLGAIAVTPSIRLVVTMDPRSGGGTFVVRLRTSAAPATVERLTRLAAQGYYDGLTFHRVEPTFVIQGGSPRATEYVGDGPFMRDELDLASHTAGTLGISTRGRDTGDAQIFVNLTDNFRLDHDYTVVGEVDRGMDVVEGILEGDVIASVRVERTNRR